jgi:hypothetical protein
MAKTKKQNSVQISTGGYTLSPTYSVTYPSNVGITGTNGLTYTTATGASTWATNITLDPYYTKKPRVEITDTDLVIDGLSLKDFMRSVQKELLIPGRLNRNTELEAEFAELAAAAKRYHKLEEKFLEQKAMWETLKKTDQ